MAKLATSSSIRVNGLNSWLFSVEPCPPEVESLGSKRETPLLQQQQAVAVVLVGALVFVTFWGSSQQWNRLLGVSGCGCSGA